MAVTELGRPGTCAASSRTSVFSGPVILPIATMLALYEHAQRDTSRPCEKSHDT